MITIADKRRDFRRLHEASCFVIPNPWDIGTARYLQHLGFKALATTSAGFAFSQGLPDTAVPRDIMLGHIREIVAATDVPVNADFENGYVHEPEGVAENVRLCVETGVAGLSIEDSTGERGKPLYDIDLAVARICAARAAIDSSRRRRSAHGPRGVLPCPSSGRAERIDPPARRLCGGGGRLSLCTGVANARGDRHGG